jgi:hypothetical protein
MVRVVLCYTRGELLIFTCSPFHFLPLPWLAGAEHIGFVPKLEISRGFSR